MQQLIHSIDFAVQQLMLGNLRRSGSAAAARLLQQQDRQSQFAFWLQDVRGRAAVDAVRAALGAPGWGDAVLAQLAHTHPASAGTGQTLQSR